MQLPSSLSRRTLLIRSAAYAAGAVAGSAVLSNLTTLADDAPPPTTFPAKPLYSFILLGDMHYDLPEHHDMNWVKANKPNDLHQIESYIDVSTKHTPALMKRINNILSTSETPIPFVVHVGDLVEGLCGSYALHARQLQDAMDLVDRSHFGVPFLMCKGNHDITGPGANHAFDDVLLPWLGAQARQNLSSASFVLRHDRDLFVFFDAYKPDLDWLQRQFDENANCRHVFFVVHEPVVPYNDRADWIVFSKETENAERGRLLSLLGKRKALVLSGHLHKYSALERATPSGSFSQLAVCSVVRSDHPAASDERSGVKQYDDSLIQLEPNFEPTTVDRRRALIHKEQAEIRRFEYADLPGYAIVDVHEDGVDCRVFSGTGPDLWRSVSFIDAS